MYLDNLKKGSPFTGESLDVMKVYEVNGEKRRILWIHKGGLQYDHGNYGDVPKLSSVYRFISWLLTNSPKW